MSLGLGMFHFQENSKLLFQATYHFKFTPAVCEHSSCKIVSTVLDLTSPILVTYLISMYCCLSLWF